LPEAWNVPVRKPELHWAERRAGADAGGLVAAATMTAQALRGMGVGR
jgi:hypothetical protein